MRRAPIVIFLVALVAAAGALAWRNRNTPAKVLARIAAGPARPIEARLSSPAADRHRPFAAGNVPGNALDDLAWLEAAGDRQALAEAEILTGQGERALEALSDHDTRMRGDGPDLAGTPEQLVDRAAVELGRGHATAALVLCDRALAQHPARRGPAMWNRALALSSQLLPLAAAVQLEEVANLGEPGWADEARTRAQALRAGWKQRSELQRRAIDLGVKFAVDRTALPDDVIDSEPDMARLYLYDAVRTATSPEQVRALAPLAARLDRHFGGSVLADLITHTAAANFAKRRPLAELYRAAVHKAWAAPGPETDKLLADAFNGGEDTADLFLGAEYLAFRRDLDAAKYVGVARARHDPWFDALAADTEASAASNRGDLSRAAAVLQPALDRCWAAHLEYRCLRLADTLTMTLMMLLRLDDAERLALDGLHRAQARDASEVTAFVRNLVETARLRNQNQLMQAYLTEMAQQYPDDCGTQQYAHEIRAESALMRCDADETRRELDAVPRCNPPRYSLLGVALLGYLQREHARKGDRQLMGESLSGLRASPRMSGGMQRELDVYEALAIMHEDASAGRAALEHAVAEAKKLPDDDNARRARSDGSIALIIDDANAKRWDQAHRRFADALDRAEPHRCSLGVLIDIEIVVLAWRDANGNAAGKVVKVHSTDLPASTLVPAEVVKQLDGCGEIGVLALPPINGQPDLLPSTVAWSYGVAPESAVPPATAPRRVVVADVNPPAGLGLAPLAPHTAPPQPNEIVLRGPMATASRVLAELGDADEAELDVHGLVVMGSSDASLLVLSPDGSGHYALTANDLRRTRLTKKPIVALAACSAAHTAPYMHEVWSLPSAFVEAGARAVLAPASPIPDLETTTFFANVFERVHRGASPAIALRDERQLWLARKQLWTKDIMLFQ